MNPWNTFRRREMVTLQGALRIGALLSWMLANPGGHPLQAAEPIHQWEVLAHFRLLDGTEKTVHLDDFHFVYYERHYIRRLDRTGAPPKLEIVDSPQEFMSIQNEGLQRLRFSRISTIRLEYRLEDGRSLLYLVAIPLSPKNATIAWPVFTLRNVSTARFPHFRGSLDGKVMDVDFPPLEESGAGQEEVLTSIDFRFPGQTKHRTWL